MASCKNTIYIFDLEFFCSGWSGLYQKEAKEQEHKVTFGGFETKE